MNISFAGGCFTKQTYIPFEGHYHQTVKTILENKLKQTVNSSIIRYERLSKTIDKIENQIKTGGIDLLVFHLRTEPAMRMSKFYYKFLTENNILKHAVNLPWNKNISPEKYDMLHSRRIAFDSFLFQESPFVRFMREMNYRIGTLIGNRKRAIRLHSEFIIQLNDFCKKNNIILLLIGPVARPCSSFENKLSELINKKFKNFSGNFNIHYLEIIGLETNGGESLFMENMQHVSQAGHNYIGEKIAQKVIKILE